MPQDFSPSSVTFPTLVLGGARSGKSQFAEKLAHNSGLTRIYLATATAGDDEMRGRIAHHRNQRGEGWRTVEEPLELTEALARESAAERIVLVDCLTLWLSNLMHAGRDPAQETQKLTDWLRSPSYPVLLVSNEVGLGLVPETPLGREFRDAQGRLNQAVAAAVPNVVFVAAGLPLWLKRDHVEKGSFL
ncbi:MAG TPA: bifunctional adenosylcobinamide kinase/adenosylcobinamide-phosphate guanylyltransferase [Xanthobacteraceae bacterium]